MPKRGVNDNGESPKPEKKSPIKPPVEKKVPKLVDERIGDNLSTTGDTLTPVQPPVSRFVVNKKDPIALNALRDVIFPFLKSIKDGDSESQEVITDLKSRVDSTLKEEDSSIKRQDIDSLFREYLLQEVILNLQPWSPLISLSITLSKKSIASPLLPISLLVDLIDLLPLQECARVFEFIEKRLAMWQEPHFYTCKNAMLRLCNDLLRRLSQTQNTIFCGRILMFLSAYFPFSERSGLNVMSEFNTDNVTVYKTTDGSDDPEDHIQWTQEKEETLFEGIEIQIPGLDKVVAQCQEQKKKNLNVDYNMYTKFWSLQDFLKNPNLCYNKVQWKTFTTYLMDLLQALESSKLIEEPEQPISAPNHSQNKEDQQAPVNTAADEIDSESGWDKLIPVTDLSSSFCIPTLANEDLYFAKYLSNRRVLELEMSDAQFRKSFLVQVLIVLQYLVLPVKFKSDVHVLNEEQIQFVTKTNDRIYAMLSQIKPGGGKFVENVKHVLKREEIWNKWKNEGCPAIKKPTPPPVSVSTDPKLEKGSKSELKKGSTASASSTSKKEDGDFEEVSKPKAVKKHRPRLGLILKNASNNNKFSLGNSELNRLWNICPDNLAACRAKNRDFMPSIETYFAEAMKELDQEPFDPKKEVIPKEILGNANFGWRGLRLLARRSPYFFQMVSGCGTPIFPLQKYLEFVLRKIAADLEISNAQSAEVAKEPVL